VLGGEGVLGELPGFELGLDGGVEGELAVLDEAHGGHGGEGFADGRGLEEAGGGDGRAVFFEDAVAFGPLDFAVVDDGDADGGDVKLLHLGQKVHAVGRLAGDDDGGEEAGLYGLDVLLGLAEGAGREG
jgi:hypothetical protein